MPSQPPTGRESDKFNLRLPDGMREILKARAQENGRSLNSEIIARLMTTLAPPPYDPQTISEYIDERLYAAINKAIGIEGLTLDDVRRVLSEKRARAQKESDDA